MLEEYTLKDLGTLKVFEPHNRYLYESGFSRRATNGLQAAAYGSNF